ncbi:MAG TPA: hypothetical protein VN328_08135 [Thermodesulfovibrionales bacterium]|nr:hypothetical protein [Thermodesulfovibrionales bacterium]
MEDNIRCDLQEGLDGTLGLAGLRTMPDIVEKIKWDVTPEVIMEPRFQLNPEDAKKLKEITGYMFYIETQCEPPALMLMKVGKTDITSTIGKIDEVPKEFIQRAIDNPIKKPVYGMLAITDEIKEWLQKELNK